MCVIWLIGIWPDSQGIWGWGKKKLTQISIKKYRYNSQNAYVQKPNTRSPDVYYGNKLKSGGIFFNTNLALLLPKHANERHCRGPSLSKRNMFQDTALERGA